MPLDLEKWLRDNGVEILAAPSSAKHRGANGKPPSEGQAHKENQANHHGQTAQSTSQPHQTPSQAAQSNSNSTFFANSSSMSDAIAHQEILDRAEDYIRQVGGSIQGQNGSANAYKVACQLIKDWGLSIDDAFPIFQRWSDDFCIPPWSDQEISHKLDSAERSGDKDGRERGWKRTENRNGYAAETIEDDGGDFGSGLALVEIESKSTDSESIQSLPQPSTNGTAHKAAQQGQLVRQAKKLKKPRRSPSIEKVLQFALKMVSEGKDIQYMLEHKEFMNAIAFISIRKPADFIRIKNVFSTVNNYTSASFNIVFASYVKSVKLENLSTVKLDHNLTDMGNAKRIADKHSNDIKYCHGYDCWMMYDETRWESDKKKTIQEYAKQISGAIIEEKPKTIDPESSKHFDEWAIASQSSYAIDCAIKLATSDFRIAISNDQLDSDPWLLNVRNGTINLKDMTLKKHDRNDLITKICNIKFDPKAKCPTWEKFCLDVMVGRKSLVEYLQRAVGYSMTGVIREHVLFFLYGGGRNGKGTFTTTVGSILGDYCKQLNPKILLSSDGDRHPTEITELEGRRMVLATEPDDNKRLAESFIKDITGDPKDIQARKLFKDFYFFKPTHHIWLSANHKPEVREITVAFWERLKLIPFDVHYTEKGEHKIDHDLKDKLAAEWTGIFNWMLEGCRMWLSEGLNEPQEITDGVESYRNEMDVLGLWLDNWCEVGDGFKTNLTVMYQCYSNWCNDGGIKPLGIRKLSSSLTDKGFNTFRSNSESFKLGIRLLSREERAYRLGHQDDDLSKLACAFDPRILNQINN